MASFSGLVSLVMLELGVRALLPSYHPGRQIAFRYEPDGTPLGPKGQRVRQRTPKGDYDLEVAFNRHGLRDDKDLATAQAGDWMVVGDSFAMGWGVPREARFSDLLDAGLDGRVFNVAIPGDFVSYEKLLQLAQSLTERRLPRVMSVCMENDLHRYSDEALAGNATPRPPETTGLRTWLKTRSGLYLLLSTKLQANPAIRQALEDIGVARRVDSDELMPQNRFEPDALDDAARMLARLNEGARAVILIIPARGLWMGSKRPTERSVHEHLMNALRRGGLDVVDMKPLLEATGRPLDYYFATDPHWSEAGHQLAAKALLDHLQR